jgi:hypothetical protein
MNQNKILLSVRVDVSHLLNILITMHPVEGSAKHFVTKCRMMYSEIFLKRTKQKNKKKLI